MAKQEVAETEKRICKGCGKKFDAKVEEFIRLDTEMLQRNVEVVCSVKCAYKVLRDYGYNIKDGE